MVNAKEVMRDLFGSGTSAATLAVSFLPHLNDLLQTIALLVSITAGVITIWRMLRRNRK